MWIFSIPKILSQTPVFVSAFSTSWTSGFLGCYFRTSYEVKTCGVWKSDYCYEDHKISDTSLYVLVRCRLSRDLKKRKNETLRKFRKDGFNALKECYKIKLKSKS